MEKKLVFLPKTEVREKVLCKDFERGIYQSFNESKHQFTCFKSESCKNFYDKCIERVSYK